MARLGPALALLAASALLAMPAAAVETRLALDYDFRLGPLRLVEMHTTVDLAEGRYSTEADMRTVGVVGFLFPWTSHAQSSGLRTDNGLRPRLHRAQGTFRGEPRLVEIDYGDEGRISARVEPAASSDWRDAVPPELQQDTVDPLTASLTAMAAGCAGTVRVFDGRRRDDLELADMGDSVVETSSDQVYSGPARRCRAVVQALGGFWRTDPRQGETPTTLDSWIAVPRPGMLALPVYLELSSARGTLRIHLTAARASNP